MQKKKKKVFRANNSNSSTKVHTVQDPMIKALSKAHINGGTISYHFITERIRFTKDNPLGEIYQLKSVLSSNINPAIFNKTVDGRNVRRTYEEIITMFQEISRDMGASHFEIS